jgi:hypothetical protein
MSTTFGILRIEIEHNKIVDEDGDLLEYISENIFEPVFFRSLNNSRWLTSFGPYLDENIKVYALDNTQQGIYTVKDCKELIKKEL